MKCLYFLLFVAVSHASVIREVEKAQGDYIPQAVISTSRTIWSPFLGFTVEWDPVPSTPDNPVLGYRVIVAQEIWSQTHRYASFQDIGLYGADNTVATVGRTRFNFWYQVQVQAITSKGYGPLSPRWRILVIGTEPEDQEQEGGDERSKPFTIIKKGE
ncbi:hypothetical protein ABMA28_000673 [Loxostege sticticalis]|uniref:Fibronectin type-III domain-containing protein n=1 Tax=Loxostege sticticalis TaxID=481309 RepID=A0ABD0T362_LOXSC